MAFEFKFPDVGEGISEGTIVKWFVRIGDEVKEDQALGEIETAKAIVEMPSPKAGIILKLGAVEGGTIRVGDILAVIGKKGEDAAPTRTPPAVVGSLPEGEQTMPLGLKSAGLELNILPYTRKLAESLNVDLTKIKGTGPGGRITEDDIKKIVSTTDSPAAALAKAGRKIRKYDMWGFIEHIPLKGIRKTVAEHMTKSLFTAPHVTHFDKCDVTELVALRGNMKKDFEAKGVKLTYLPFIIKAVIQGLKEYPLLNASLDESGESIIVKKYFNIGFAVDTQDGLMAPVIKRADTKSIFDIAKELQDLAQKARERKIDLMDLRGGTFTISNIGSIGGTFFTPIINYPEVAILGVAAIRKEPAVVNGKIEARDILHLGVTFDHRVADGAMAARFLNTVIERLGAPRGLC